MEEDGDSHREKKKVECYLQLLELNSLRWMRYERIRSKRGREKIHVGCEHKDKACLRNQVRVVGVQGK